MCTIFFSSYSCIFFYLVGTMYLVTQKLESRQMEARRTVWKVGLLPISVNVNLSQSFHTHQSYGTLNLSRNDITVILASGSDLCVTIFILTCSQQKSKAVENAKKEKFFLYDNILGGNTQKGKGNEKLSLSRPRKGSILHAVSSLWWYAGPGSWSRNSFQQGWSCEVMGPFARADVVGPSICFSNCS